MPADCDRRLSQSLGLTEEQLTELSNSFETSTRAVTIKILFTLGHSSQLSIERITRFVVYIFDLCSPKSTGQHCSSAQLLHFSVGKIDFFLTHFMHHVAIAWPQ
ncbi:hypothetical protein Tsp_12571 [Trichinella spiralis]|uniref:hypothetical protein n=1 Tax=Trichinella spiralis TaxID=6334 RepID=UPI0001EFE5BA|nr:hypothetical protein Tsp_12571 [Trichinella spiralis]